MLDAYSFSILSANTSRWHPKLVRAAKSATPNPWNKTPEAYPKNKHLTSLYKCEWLANIVFNRKENHTWLKTQVHLQLSGVTVIVESLIQKATFTLVASLPTLHRKNPQSSGLWGRKQAKIKWQEVFQFLISEDWWPNPIHFPVLVQVHLQWGDSQ